jgi:hypothetical protein
METRDGGATPGSPLVPAPGDSPGATPRQRAHARVEDRIRTGKDTGLKPLPVPHLAINAAWLAVVMLAVDLLAWT